MRGLDCSSTGGLSVSPAPVSGSWWRNIKDAVKKLNATAKFDPKNIAAIGIAYQMHGLVLVDKQQKVLRDSIIWCDSRAIETGNAAFKKIGEQRSLSNLLNSPGNFTASKLSWVRQNEPKIFESSYKMMLPGDFAAMKLTGEITTTSSALSEGIFWDFKEDELSKDVMDCFGFDEKIIPQVRPLFSSHGSLLADVAKELSLKPGIPVGYKAGDQLNNALSLNVFHPGEVAATAGTSGVIYAVTDSLFFDKLSRVNAFAHVGALRNNNSRMLQTLGKDTGWDSIGDFGQAVSLARFLDKLDRSNKLTKTILYNLNPADNELFATMTGNFNDGSMGGKIQWGSAWWFLDQKDGMVKQLNALSNMSLLSYFVGMITDSRSFLSYPRHEYFRRILCDLFGDEIENGELLNDLNWTGKVIQDICFYNARNYFGWKEKLQPSVIKKATA